MIVQIFRTHFLLFGPRSFMISDRGWLCRTVYKLRIYTVLYFQDSCIFLFWKNFTLMIYCISYCNLFYSAYMRDYECMKAYSGFQEKSWVYRVIREPIKRLSFPSDQIIMKTIGWDVQLDIILCPNHERHWVTVSDILQQK